MFGSVTENEVITKRLRTPLGPNWLGQTMALAIALANKPWKAHRTKSALLELSDEQRKDCGIDRPDIPTTSQREAAARRRLTSGMPTEWC
jgi:uncharacterized protein YjiS (DUF1127 family)